MLRSLPFIRISTCDLAFFLMWVWFWGNWARDNMGCKSEDLTAPYRAGHCSPFKPTHSSCIARWDEPLLPSWCSSLPAAWERAVPLLERKQPAHLQTLIMTFIFYLGKLCPCYTQLSACWSLGAAEITALSQPENTAQPQHHPAEAAGSITPPGTSPCSGQWKLMLR